MKNIVFVTFFIVFTFILSNISYALNINGWWKADSSSNSSAEILLITEDNFCGLPYNVIDKSNSEVSISIQNAKKATKIKIINDNTIVITTVNGKEITYSLISHDTNITRNEATRLSKGIN